MRWPTRPIVPGCFTSRCTSAPVHQCTSAPVHQCTSAPVHQCISAPVHQCISAPVRRAVGAHGAGCGARARVGWTPQLRTSSDSGEEVTTTPPASTSPPVTGTHIESLPEAREAVSGTSKRRRHSLAEGTRAGASDVAAWRDVVLVSFWGNLTATSSRARCLRPALARVSRVGALSLQDRPHRGARRHARAHRRSGG